MGVSWEQIALANMDDRPASSNSGYHLAMDALGTFEPTGVVDVVHAMSFAAEGDTFNAGITLLGVLPLFGDAAKGPRAFKNGVRALGHSDDFVRYGDNVLGMAPQFEHFGVSGYSRSFSGRPVASIGSSSVVLDDVVGSINHNADVATELARRAAVRGRINASPKAFGSRSHLYFERLNKRLNRRLADQGTSYRVAAEEFRDTRGLVTPKRALDSIGADAIVRSVNDVSINQILDLKTHGGVQRPISPNRQGQFLNRFDAQAQEIFRQQ